MPIPAADDMLGVSVHDIAHIDRALVALEMASQDRLAYRRDLLMRAKSPDLVTALHAQMVWAWLYASTLPLELPRFSEDQQAQIRRAARLWV